MNDWLKTIKAGDEVVHRNGSHLGLWRVVKVEKTTATQIVVGGTRYRRKDGRPCGGGYYDSLEEPTPKLLAQMDEDRRERDANSTIRVLTGYTNWRYWPIEKKERLASILKELSESEAEKEQAHAQ